MEGEEIVCSMVDGRPDDATLDALSASLSFDLNSASLAACSALVWISTCLSRSLARIGTRSSGTRLFSLKLAANFLRSLSFTFFSCLLLLRCASCACLMRSFSVLANCLNASEVARMGFSAWFVGAATSAGAFVDGVCDTGATGAAAGGGTADVPAGDLTLISLEIIAGSKGAPETVGTPDIGLWLGGTYAPAVRLGRSLFTLEYLSSSSPPSSLGGISLPRCPDSISAAMRSAFRNCCA